MKLTVDADVITYQIGFASQKKVDGELLTQPVELVDHFLLKMVDSIVNTVEPDEYLLCLSGPGNFRNSIAVTKPYKGNRKDMEKPVYYDHIREVLSSGELGPCNISVDEEADDVMGYTQCAEEPNDCCIATIDKDLNMIPGLHYNWTKESLYTISPKEAALTFYKQLLTGDSTDNIVGIPKIGPVRAAKALSGTEDEDGWKEIVHSMYQSYYGKDCDHLIDEMGKLLWIRREPGQLWDFEMKCLTE